MHTLFCATQTSMYHKKGRGIGFPMVLTPIVLSKDSIFIINKDWRKNLAYRTQNLSVCAGSSTDAKLLKIVLKV